MPGQTADSHLVDDDGDLHLVSSIVLIQEGYRVRSTEDGFSAFCEIRNKVPDIISSGISMPGMSSFEFLSIVNRRFPTISAIAMSGAFASDSIPLGVATDASHVKGSDRLLHLVETMTRPGRQTSPRYPNTLAPIWIARTGHNPSGERTAQISCPECLTAFTQGIEDANSCTREAGCA